jgi:hypothetical protein
MDSNLMRLMVKQLGAGDDDVTVLIMDTTIHNVINSMMDMMLVSIPRV